MEWHQNRLAMCVGTSPKKHPEGWVGSLSRDGKWNYITTIPKTGSSGYDLKKCPCDSNKILYRHSTPKGTPACAKASKSYDWSVRNIDKISPKMAKKQSIFVLIRISQKLSERFDGNFLQSFYTLLESYMCNGI